MNKKMKLFIDLNKNLTDNHYIKRLVNDSLNNHRTASVNQAIKYLRTYENSYHRNLANRLEAAYKILRPTMKTRRQKFTRRSDAFDLTEFKAALVHVIVSEGQARYLEDNL